MNEYPIPKSTGIFEGYLASLIFRVLGSTIIVLGILLLGYLLGGSSNTPTIDFPHSFRLIFYVILAGAGVALAVALFPINFFLAFFSIFFPTLIYDLFTLIYFRSFKKLIEFNSFHG